MNTVAVYCGANTGNNPIYAKKATQLAHALVKRDIRMIFGGGSVGIMGIMADEILKKGGKATGVITEFLMGKEVGHAGIDEMIVTGTMLTRKQIMIDRADATVILPGGYGTMDELFEVLTWLQLGTISKPVGLLNVNRFYNPLLKQLDRMVEDGFLRQQNRELLLTYTEPNKLLDALANFEVKTAEKWM